jgi:hypothetical protein
MRAVVRTHRNIRTTNRTWSLSEFTRELAKVEEIGINKISNEDLLRFCRGAHGCFGHYLADLQPSFQEVWRRIEDGRITLTKTEACKLIGCSLRWAEKIVDGTARDSNGAKEERTETVGASQTPAQRSNQDFVLDVTRYAEMKLRPLIARGERDRCRNINKLVANYFIDAGNVAHVDEVSSNTQENGGPSK